MDLCRCGRAIVLLNVASDTPKCKGCGRLPDACPCTGQCHCGSLLVWDSYNQTARVCEDCGYPNELCDCMTDEEALNAGQVAVEVPN